MILPTVLQSSPITAIRRTLSDYSLRSRQRVTTLALQYGSQPEPETASSSAIELAFSRRIEMPISPGDTKRKYITQGFLLPTQRPIDQG